MFDRTLLSLFFVCLFGCAGMMLTNIWLGKNVLPPLYFQIMASLFIVGLTAFLTWFVRMARKIHLVLKG